MRIVQTAWACNQRDLLNFDAGWLSPEYHLMAWALSCLQLKKFYNIVVLYADSVTSDMLINMLQLPYSEASTELDQFYGARTELFALPKIHVYEQQKTPFLHVDADVFIWKPFDHDLLESDLIAQNLEFGTSYYQNTFKRLEAELIFVPDEIIEEQERKEKIHTYNAGIFGGNDLTFLQFYATRSKELIARNSVGLSNSNLGIFNVYAEQYYFYCLSRKNNKKVNVLFNRVFPDTGYLQLGGFIDVPHTKHYIHLVGRLKKNKRVCDELANRLREDYPEYYYRIIALFKKNHVPLKKDFYFSINHPTEQYLTARYFDLKDRFPLMSDTQVFTNDRSQAKTLRTSKLNIAENLTCTLQGQNSSEVLESIQEILYEAELFEEKLCTIIDKNFSRYTFDYLYARDISYTNYFNHLFANKDDYYHKSIVADKIVEFFDCPFDWSSLDDKLFKPEELPLRPEVAKICIVPECHAKGYTLVKIDELDFQLLEELREPTMIVKVLDQLRPYFDLEDKEAVADFETLIIGRIKILLQEKIIKAVL